MFITSILLVGVIYVVFVKRLCITKNEENIHVLINFFTGHKNLDQSISEHHQFCFLRLFIDLLTDSRLGNRRDVHTTLHPRRTDRTVGSGQALLSLLAAVGLRHACRLHLQHVRRQHRQVCDVTTSMTSRFTEFVSARGGIFDLYGCFFKCLFI